MNAGRLFGSSPKHWQKLKVKYLVSLRSGNAISGLLETLFVERIEQNEDIFARFMNERDFQNLVSHWVSRQVYGRLRVAAERDSSQPDGGTRILGA